MTHLPSPASASSSTLIVTPLPSKESQESIQIDDLPPAELVRPTARLKPKPKPKPQLALALAINTTAVSTMPGLTTTTTAHEPKMSSKGFVEPHHGHLPRRTKTKTKEKEKERERAKSVSVVSADAMKTRPELTRGVTSSTNHSAAASSASPTAPAPVPPISNATASPHQETSSPHLASTLQTPPSSSSPPSHPFIPRHELAPPTYLTSLRLPPSPPPPVPFSHPLPLSSAALATPRAAGFASPAFATPGGSATPHTNLPRRKVEKRRRGSDGRVTDKNVSLKVDVNVDAVENAEGVEGAESDERAVSFAFHSGSGSTSAGGNGGGGHVRHVREGAEQDGFGSTSSQSSASEAGASRAGTRSPTPAPRGLARDGTGVHAGAAGGARISARSSTRPRLSTLDEGASYGPPSSARLWVGKRARVRGVSLPRLRVGESPLRTSFVGAHGFGEEVDPFRSAKGRESLSAKRREDKVQRMEMGMGMGMGMRMGMGLQEVGRGSQVEVGFLDEEGGRGVDFWGLGTRAGGEGVEGGGEHRQEPKRRVVLRVIEDLPGSSSKSNTGVASPTANTSHDVFAPETTRTTPAASSSSSTPIAQERQELELVLSLPDDLPSYRDGETVLSPEQLRQGCEFIVRHLSGTTEREKKKKIRILAPRARPEDGMSLALCYLAYHRDSSDCLFRSLHRYFRDYADDDVVEEGHEDEDETAWYRSLSPAHLLYMRLLDEPEGEGEGEGEGRDTRGRESSRHVEVDADGLGRTRDDELTRKVEEAEYAGIRAEWRGVLSFDGLSRVDEAGRGQGRGDVEA